PVAALEQRRVGGGGAAVREAAAAPRAAAGDQQPGVKTRETEDSRNASRAGQGRPKNAAGPCQQTERSQSSPRSSSTSDSSWCAYSYGMLGKSVPNRTRPARPSSRRRGLSSRGKTPSSPNRVKAIVVSRWTRS